VTQPGVAAMHRKPMQSRAILRREALRIALGLAIGGGVAALLGGCASAPKPTLLSGRLQAADGVNPSVSKRPSPLLVRMYELKSATAFNNADFVALFQRDQAELGADLLGREEIMLNPGESRRSRRRLRPRRVSSAYSQPTATSSAHAGAPWSPSSLARNTTCWCAPTSSRSAPRCRTEPGAATHELAQQGRLVAGHVPAATPLSTGSAPCRAPGRRARARRRAACMGLLRAGARRRRARTRRLGIVRALGILPDGTPFAIPQDDAAPPRWTCPRTPRTSSWASPFHWPAPA